MNRPVYRKGVIVRLKEAGGKPIVIPSHFERIVGLRREENKKARN